MQAINRQTAHAVFLCDFKRKSDTALTFWVRTDQQYNKGLTDLLQFLDCPLFGGFLVLARYFADTAVCRDDNL